MSEDRAPAPPSADAPRPGAAAPADVPGPERRELEDAPPFLSWRGIYALVLGALAVEIVLLALLARHAP